MKKLLSYILLAAGLLTATSCNDYLDVKSPSNADDEFVSSTPDETFKVLSRAYAKYRQDGVAPLYFYNDPVGSDIEMYPEENSSNNLNAILKSYEGNADQLSGAFNGAFNALSLAQKVADLVKAKDAYKSAVAAGQKNDWTQLYGEAITLRAFCYFNLVKHFGDLPYGYENTYVEDYSLTSRFAIYDDLIRQVKEVEPLMYEAGENNITTERITRGYANALIGQMALFAGGWQTIRTDVDGLYGDVQFETQGIDKNGCIYARRKDYIDYYKIADTYLKRAFDYAGTVHLVTTDDRSYANNPFQRNFQYNLDLTVSPESFFELGTHQGAINGYAAGNEVIYNAGRPSAGGNNNAAPCKVFAAVRPIPTFYYGGYDNADKRRDVSVAVTGSKGDGNETLLSFRPGNKTSGGLGLNKWDDNRMSPPYTVSMRQSGVNYVILRAADVILMQAEVKAELGEPESACALLNQIRERAFGDQSHDLHLTGDDLKEAIWNERKCELLGEGERRFDMIRSGHFTRDAFKVRSEMAAMINGLRTNGYYRFANGNVISNYVYIKKVHMDSPLTYDCTDETNPVLFPGWRGQYDYSTTSVANKVNGMDHNVAIKGLFRYIDPNGSEARQLESEGYVKTAWGIELVNNEKSYDRNILSGLDAENEAPRYFFPLPAEVISKSKGKITNGYGLAQQ